MSPRHVGKPATLLLVALLSGGCSTDAPVGGRSNVLLISIDSLRADHLGCYGYERETSPRIDALAREGILFEESVSSTSWTLPSHATLFTGLPESIHGCDSSIDVLADDRLTLAEHLRNQGYRTAGVWSGPYLHPLFGLEQGFESYANASSNPYFEAAEDLSRQGAPRGQGEANRHSHEDVTSPRVVELATDWLSRHSSSGPFFLFVHFWDVHYDFIPPPPYDTRFDPDYAGPVDGRGLGNERMRPEDLSPADLAHLVALYDGEIAWTDEHVGRLLDHLEELGRAEDTLVVLLSDHGEEFFEHGRFGHRKTLYQESIRIPLIARLPDGRGAGTRVTEVVGMADLAPTILAWIGAEPLPNGFGRALAGPTESLQRGFAISELTQPKRDGRLLALRLGRWKFVIDADSGRALELYDLREDPGEETELLSTGRPVPDLVRSRLEQILQRMQLMRDELTAGDAGAEMPAELREELQALGYLGNPDDPDDGGDGADKRKNGSRKDTND